MEYKKLNIKKTAVIDDLYTFFAESYGKGYYFDGEAHDFYEVVCVIDGQAGITADGHAFVLRCGQAVVHKPNVFHKIWSSGDERTSVVIFSFGGFIDLPEETAVFDMDDGINEIIRLSTEKNRIFTFDDICFKAVKNGKGEEESIFVNSLERFLMKLIRNRADIEPTTKTAEDYSEIIRVLEDNIGKNLSLAEIAVLCRMSCPKLKKVFSKYSGMGVITYFNSMKMRRAEELLRGGMTVKETAFRLGFADQNYFSYAFKKYMGKPPKMFRQNR